MLLLMTPLVPPLGAAAAAEKPSCWNEKKFVDGKGADGGEEEEEEEGEATLPRGAW